MINKNELRNICIFDSNKVKPIIYSNGPNIVKKLITLPERAAITLSVIICQN